MKAVDVACDLARRFEGCRLTAYRDPVGYWTVGWGHLLSHDKTADFSMLSWSQEEADDALEKEMAQFLAGVKTMVRANLSDNAIGALTDFAYNLGLRSLRASTLLRCVNASDVLGASLEFQKWKFAGGRVLPGLIRRRAAEREVFLGYGG